MFFPSDNHNTISSSLSIRAVEANNDIVIKVLKRVGVKDTYRDKDGLTPADLRKKDEL